MELLNPVLWKWVCFFMWVIGTFTVIISQMVRRRDWRAEKMDFNDPVHTVMRVTFYSWLTMWVFVAFD